MHTIGGKGTDVMTLFCPNLTQSCGNTYVVEKWEMDPLMHRHAATHPYMIPEAGSLGA